MARPLSDNEIRTAESLFRAYLRDHHLKFTPERQQLLDEVLNNPEHFEADQLLVSLRQSGKRVAKATIYRTLPLLVDCGIIKQVQFGEAHAHYEYTLGQTPHDHMFCRECHRIIEFDSGAVVRLRDDLARQYDFEPLFHRLQITGICAQCRGVSPTADPPLANNGKTASRGRRKTGSPAR